MLHLIPTYIKDGREYMRIWPMEKQLYTMFPECRIISATKFGIQVMPPIAIMMVALQLHYLGGEFLAQALTVGIFFISLPLQGLFWLGNRSNQVLPPSMMVWCRDIHSKMQQQGCALETLPPKPRFKELARLLRTAFKELDRAFTKDLF
ncbi:terminus macrodomain insulation protein YfbV [Glaciecola sp. SC05]|uniref:terminus macrodomain insulation protein YfbV n=1 Tax=Glaciecola sp. SC05 TaxID=1987355 RepID=UPI0035291E2E